MADAEPTATDDLTSRLEHQLREKEMVIAALTDRLEQAANQLDRMHRTGADRGPRTAGVPTQLVESQQNLLGELQQAVQQWEDLQAASSLGRIEIQLTEMRDLMVQRFDRLQSTGVPVHGGVALPDSGQEGASPGKRPADADPHDPAGGWDAVRAMLLADNPPAKGDGSSDHADRSESQPHPGGQPDQHGGTAASPAEFELPEPVDLDHAERDELALAVLDRDDCIAGLLQRLRESEMRLVSGIDWESLNAAPEELAGELQEMRIRLQQRLREAEVELSLERARLSREEVRLKQAETELRKTMKQLGLKLPNPDDEESAAEPAARESGGRWMRLLGRSTPQDD